MNRAEKRRLLKQAKKAGAGALASGPKPWARNPALVSAMETAQGYYNRNQPAPAAALCEKVLKEEPRHPDALHLLGLIAFKAGDAAVAAERIKSALKIFPASFEALNSLGMVTAAQGRYKEAIPLFKKALRINPDYPVAHNNLGNTEKELGRLGPAIEHYRRAIALHPGYAQGHYNLGIALKDRGDMMAALASFDEAVTLAPQYLDAHYARLFALCHKPGVTQGDLLQAHRVLDRLHPPSAKASVVAHGDAAQRRPLVVGLLGRGKVFGRHPALWLTLPALEALDADAVTLNVYAHGMPPADDFEERLRRRVAGWRDIGGMDGARAAEAIRADGVDILVSMSGPVESRLDVFAHRAAPVQAVWGGMWGTTGLSSADWIIADGREVPPGMEREYAERVWRMPDGYALYQPPVDAPDVTPLPALANGYVTFAGFNKSAKVNRDALALWAGALKAVADSRLFLKGAGYTIAAVADGIRDFFAAQGVAADRILLEGPTSQAGVFRDYGRVDIALDPVPYSGGLTTCEALWMGVPVLSLPGDSFPSRHSASHLANVGLADWVVDTPEAFAEKAAWWARRPDDLADLRSGLRARVGASPLCDGPRFAGNLETAFRSMLADAGGG